MISVIKKIRSLGDAEDITDAINLKQMNSRINFTEFNVLGNLTSNTSNPNVIISGSSNNSTVYLVTDGNTSTVWSPTFSTTTNSNIIIQFLDCAHKITKFTIAGTTASAPDVPMNWFVAVGNNGTTWTTVYTSSNIIQSSSQTLIIDPSGYFKYYKFEFPPLSSGTSMYEIRTLQLFENRIVINDIINPTSEISPVPK